MKRLLIFHPAPAPYRTHFFNELGRRFHLHVVFLRSEAEEIMVEQAKLLEDATYTYETLPGHFRLLGRDLGHGYGRILKRERPDVVIASEFGASLLLPLLLRRCRKMPFRLLTMCDDSLGMALERQGGRRQRARWMLRRCDGIITVSAQMARWYMEHTPAQRAEHFPIIQDETLVRADLEHIMSHAAAHIADYGLAGKRVGLFVGRFVEVKNLPLLLSVVASLKDMPGDWRLVMVGDGDEEPSLRRQVEEAGLSGNIVFAGRHTGLALWAWYAAASFLVLPSHHEAFGAVVGEAMQMGCPALVSRHAGAAAVVAEAKEKLGHHAGDIFSPDETEDFRQKILRAYREALPLPAEGFRRTSLLPFTFRERMDNLQAFLEEPRKV
ncbi:MAG: glycosyltransferase [Bacteroidales bacterium]|nr:glycosyltransferase [Bacteroidales bacterium]